MTTEKIAVETRSYTFQILSVLGGSLFLALMAQISIPIGPVPISLQSLGVLLLGLVLGPKKGALAVIAYLLEASAGFPIIAGGVVKPLWFISPTAGYLVGFIMSAYIAGFAKGKPLLNSIILLTVADGIVMGLGTLWLSGFMPLTQAVAMGFTPFILGECFKILTAAFSVKGLSAIFKQ